MTLDKLIQIFEKGNIEDTDFEHPLARSVIEELAQCEENELQRNIFNDAKILSDGIIERYLKLDREDKLKIAEIYENEGCFKEIEGLNPSSKSRLTNNLGKQNLELLFYISNYSKITPILENYCDWIENSTDINPSQASLSNYLVNYNDNGERVERNSGDSLFSLFRFNFKEGRMHNSVNSKKVFASLTYGVSETLKEKVREAESLLPLRIKALENYCELIENSDKINPKQASLLNYLTTHNLEGNKGSLISWSYYDFKKRKKIEKNEYNTLIKLLTYGVPKNLKKRVKEAETLLPLRIKVLENYCELIENTCPTPGKTVLPGYLRSHNINGDEVDFDSKESINSWRQYDFKEMTSLKKSNSKICLESITHGVPRKLKKKVEEAENLLPLRIKVLENYIKWVIENNPSIKQIRLMNYLINHDINGDAASRGSEESLSSFCVYDFKERKEIKINSDTCFNSICYGVSEDLKTKVEETECLLPLRIKVLKNYCNWFEKTDRSKSKSTLDYYLNNHNLQGNKVKRNECSLYKWLSTDFIEKKQLKTKDPKSIIKSLTYRIKDQELVEKVRKYALGK